MLKTFKENVKNTVPKVMAPLVAAEKSARDKKGVSIGLFNGVGPLAAPRMQIVPPL